MRRYFLNKAAPLWLSPPRPPSLISSHGLPVQEVTRGQGPDGRGNVFISSVYKAPRGLIRDLLGLSHLPRQRPLSRLLHGEAVGAEVPPPDSVQCFRKSQELFKHQSNLIWPILYVTRQDGGRINVNIYFTR